MSRLLRQAIRKSDKTVYRLAKDSGVNDAAIYRFLNNGGSITLATLERLAPHVGLRLERVSQT